MSKQYTYILRNRPPGVGHPPTPKAAPGALPGAAFLCWPAHPPSSPASSTRAGDPAAPGAKKKPPIRWRGSGFLLPTPWRGPSGCSQNLGGIVRIYSVLTTTRSFSLSAPERADVALVAPLGDVEVLSGSGSSSGALSTWPRYRDAVLVLSERPACTALGQALVSVCAVTMADPCFSHRPGLGRSHPYQAHGLNAPPLPFFGLPSWSQGADVTRVSLCCRRQFPSRASVLRGCSGVSAAKGFADAGRLSP